MKIRKLSDNQLVLIDDYLNRLLNAPVASENSHNTLREQGLIQYDDDLASVKK